MLVFQVATICFVDPIHLAVKKPASIIVVLHDLYLTHMPHCSIEPSVSIQIHLPAGAVLSFRLCLVCRAYVWMFHVACLCAMCDRLAFDCRATWSKV